MIVGIPKETKDQEFRVGLTPGAVKELVRAGHAVVVENDAGRAIGFDNAQYRQAGATIADTAREVFDSAEMIVKVKEPQPEEFALLRGDQLLFTYLHLAPDSRQTRALMDAGCIAIAYETVTDDRGGLPLLTPMSEVAGRLSIQAGAHALEMNQGGRGLLLGGVPGVQPARICIIGGGVVGANAARVAVGFGCDITVLDRDVERLRELDDRFAGRIKTLYSNTRNLESEVELADLVIGAVLIPGAATPKLVSADMVKAMKAGAVLVDVAIDQGGCFETSRPTTHDNPTFIVDEVVHYCVANMPGGVARTATVALTNATLPFVLALADNGWQSAMTEDPHLRAGLNVCRGQVTQEAVAREQDLAYTPPDTML